MKLHRYNKGMLRVASGKYLPYDSQEGDAYLPHACDEWIIGGPDAMRALIADLLAALGEEAK